MTSPEPCENCQTPLWLIDMGRPGYPCLMEPDPQPTDGPFADPTEWWPHTPDRCRSSRQRRQETAR